MERLVSTLTPVSEMPSTLPGVQHRVPVRTRFKTSSDSHQRRDAAASAVSCAPFTQLHWFFTAQVANIHKQHATRVTFKPIHNITASQGQQHKAVKRVTRWNFDRSTHKVQALETEPGGKIWCRNICSFGHFKEHMLRKYSSPTSQNWPAHKQTNMFSPAVSPLKNQLH